MTSNMSLPTPAFKTLTAQDRTAVVARAVAAAAQVAEGHGLKVAQPAVLADRYAVRVHLRPAPVVARVSTFTALLRPRVESWLARELAVTTYLDGCGAPVVPPSDLLPPGPHLQEGFAISFWKYVKPVSEETPAPEVAGKMLAELHRVLRDYPGELPLLAPPLNDIPQGLDRLDRLGTVLSSSDLSLLRRVADRLLPAVRGPHALVQPLHGDAHAYNLIVSASGLLWNDFEDTCLGPIAWDLSSLSDPEGKMISAYQEAPEAAVIETYRKVRVLHAAVWVFALAPEVDEWVEHARGMLDLLRSYA